MCTKLLTGRKWFVLRFVAFCAFKFFRKKNKLASNCPDNLIYYTIDVYLYQPSIIFIYENLFLFMISCENLFMLISKKPLLIYTHLWEPLLLSLFSCTEMQFLRKQFWSPMFWNAFFEWTIIKFSESWLLISVAAAVYFYGCWYVFY